MLTLFCLGGVMICVGAFTTSWWVFGIGVVMFLGSFALTTWEREAHENDWRWPR